MSTDELIILYLIGISLSLLAIVGFLIAIVLFIRAWWILKYGGRK